MAHKGTPFIPSSADLAAVALSGSASDLGTGTLPIARIADGAVTLAKLANLATATVIGRNTGGTGVPESVTMAQLRTLLGLDWTETVLLAAGQDLSINVSNGADADYEWEAFIDYNATNVTLTAQLDGSSANMETVIYGVVVGNITVGSTTAIAGAGEAGQTGLLSNNVGGTAAATAELVRGRITQRTGLGPIITCDMFETDGNLRVVSTRNVRRTTTGTITSFGIHADNATGMNTGSWLRVRRVN